MNCYRRNFAVPRKKKSETYAEYHDRLSALAKKTTGAAKKALEQKAGEIARKHKSARYKPRKKSVGPGTYPWSQCVKDARVRGARDPQAVCGAIRAASRKRYPTYWEARKKRRNKRKNPSRREHLQEATESMNAVIGSVSEALQRTGKTRIEWLVSASMYAGEAIAHAEGTDDRGLLLEASTLANEVRKLVVANATARARNTSHKRPQRKAKRQKTSRKRNLGRFLRI